jgi:hypothetical protein
VTDAVLEDVAAWPPQPLEGHLPTDFLDALRAKTRD